MNVRNVYEIGFDVVHTFIDLSYNYNCYQPTFRLYKRIKIGAVQQLFFIKRIKLKVWFIILDIASSQENILDLPHFKSCNITSKNAMRYKIGLRETDDILNNNKRENSHPEQVASCGNKQPNIELSSWHLGGGLNKLIGKSDPL